MTDPARLAALAVAVVWAAAVLVVDVRTLRIPAGLAWSGLVPAVALAAAAARWWPALLGAVAMAALYLLLRLVSPAELGGGDLRLAPTVGALAGVAGPWSWGLAAAGAFLLTALIGVAVLLVGRARGRDPRSSRRVPHGPSMVVAALAVLIPAVL